MGSVVTHVLMVLTNKEAFTYWSDISIETFRHNLETHSQFTIHLVMLDGTVRDIHKHEVATYMLLEAELMHEL